MGHIDDEEDCVCQNHNRVEMVELLPMNDQIFFPFEQAFLVCDATLFRTIFRECKAIRDA